VLPLPSIRAGRSGPRWISPGSGAGPDHAGAGAPFPGHQEGPQRPQKAAERAEAAARLSARQRGRACPRSAAACPIDIPRNERDVYCAYFSTLENTKYVADLIRKAADYSTKKHGSKKA